MGTRGAEHGIVGYKVEESGVGGRLITYALAQFGSPWLCGRFGMFRVLRHICVHVIFELTMNNWWR